MKKAEWPNGKDNEWVWLVLRGRCYVHHHAVQASSARLQS